MRIPALSLCFALLLGCGGAGTTGPVGPQAAARVDGYGNLKLGQSTADVRRLLGPEERLVTGAEEVKAWTSANYVIERDALFHTGFDTVLVYNQDKQVTPIPYWKVYLAKDKVVAIKLSSFGYDTVPDIQTVGFAPSCYMLAPGTEIQKSLGPDALILVEKDQTTYTYVRRGLAVTEVGGQIRVFDIFAPLGPAEEAKLAAALHATP